MQVEQFCGILEFWVHIYLYRKISMFNKIHALKFKLSGRALKFNSPTILHGISHALFDASFVETTSWNQGLAQQATL